MDPDEARSFRRDARRRARAPLRRFPYNRPIIPANTAATDERTRAMTSLTTALREAIRTVPDWPKPGIQFRDITPVLLDPALFARIIDHLADRFRPLDVDRVAAIDARGFILGAVLARELRAGFVPVRKRGKLPAATIAQAYALEYGEAELEIHTDALGAGNRIVLVDDLIATGGTMVAALQLIERLGGQLVAGAALVDLPALGGSARLRAQGLDLHTLIEFEGH